MIVFNTIRSIKAEPMDVFNGPVSMFEDMDLCSMSMSDSDMAEMATWGSETPPRSPTRENDLSIENMMVQYNLLEENLNLDQVNFFEEEEENLTAVKEMTFPESPPGTDRNVLIQDPMWSAASKIDTAKVTTDSSQPDRRLRCDSCSGPNFDMNSSDCVDPSTVFQIGGSLSETRVHNLGIETPSDSDEEIDVVTVEKKLQVSMPTKSRRHIATCEDSKTKIVTLAIGSKPVQTQTLKGSIERQDCPTNVHNYSLPPRRIQHHRSLPASPPSSSSSSRSVKRLKRELSVPDLKRVAQKLKPMTSSGSSRNSSDSEECEVGKRTQHNVLERKRRTDLKLSFFHLRDSVPELQGQERAPKVLILRESANYIRKLIEDHKRHEREIEQLKQRKEQLKQTLSRLRHY